MKDFMRTSTGGVQLPAHRGLYYGGAWHEPKGGYVDTFSPATGENLGPTASANAKDVAAAVEAAHAAFRPWSMLPPKQRGAALREMAAVLRANKEELALLDALDCGNPVTALLRDVDIAAELIEYFAGLVYELRGSTIPMGDGNGQARSALMTRSSLRAIWWVQRVRALRWHNAGLRLGGCGMPPAPAASPNAVWNWPRCMPSSARPLAHLWRIGRWYRRCWRIAGSSCMQPG